MKRFVTIAHQRGRVRVSSDPVARLRLPCGDFTFHPIVPAALPVFHIGGAS